jgi:putative membrane protein
MRIATTISCLALGAVAAVWVPTVLAQSAAGPAGSSKEPVEISSPSTPQGNSRKLSTASRASKADSKLFVQLAEGNLAEVASAKQALAKSTDAKITAFAQHMIDDHNEALKQLAELADRKGIELPATPDEKHRKQAERMADMSPVDFNSQFAKAAVTDHRATLKLLDKITAKTEDQELKALAEKMKPVVQAHLKMALDLTANTKP